MTAGRAEGKKTRSHRDAVDRGRRKPTRTTRTWRGSRVPAFGWYVAALSVALGAFYGVVADHGHLVVVLVGLLVGIVWGAAVWAAAPLLVAIGLTVVGVFAGILAFGGSWPGAAYSGVVAQVAGMMIGIQLRQAIAARRRPGAEDTPEQAATPGWPRFLLTRSRRRDAVIAGIVAVAILVALAAFYLIPHPETYPTWLLLVGIAFAWSAVPAWFAGAPGRAGVGRAPFNVVFWGMFFNAWGSAALHGTLIVLFASLAWAVIGGALRALYDSRRSAGAAASAAT